MLLQALLTTHPRRHALMEVFRAQSLHHLGTLSSVGRLESREAFDSARNDWLTLLTRAPNSSWCVIRE
jgi:hypothetical protein